MAKQKAPTIDVSQLSPDVQKLNRAILGNSRQQNIQQMQDILAMVKNFQNKQKIKAEFERRVRQGVAIKAVGNRPRPEGFAPADWNAMSPEEQDDYLYQTEQQDVLTATRQRARAAWQGALNGARGIVSRASGRLAPVPTPGDIWFPVAVLLVLNVFLIPIKGADGTILTRAGWLFQAITGNAWLNSDSAITRTAHTTSGSPTVNTGGVVVTSRTSNQVNQYASTQWAVNPQKTSYQDLHLSLANQGLSDATQQQPVSVPSESYVDQLLRIGG
jgi:hypothetical protein